MRKMIATLGLLVAACSSSPYPTARDAVTAECSALCAWYERCDAAVDAPKCSDACVGLWCHGSDCDAPPSEDDETIDACVDAMDAKDTCGSDAAIADCFHAVRP